MLRLQKSKPPQAGLYKVPEMAI